MPLNELLLMFFTILSILLSQFEDIKYRKYSCIFGLISQIFWFIDSIVSSNYGIFIVSCFMTFIWSYSFYRYWIKNGK